MRIAIQGCFGTQTVMYLRVFFNADIIVSPNITAHLPVLPCFKSFQDPSYLGDHGTYFSPTEWYVWDCPPFWGKFSTICFKSLTTHILSLLQGLVRFVRKQGVTHSSWATAKSSWTWMCFASFFYPELIFSSPFSNIFILLQIINLHPGR